MAKPVFYRKVLSPAKLNLILRIGPLRRDGYHELETLMVPLTWGDELKLRCSPSDTFQCSIESPHLRVPVKKNLIYKAAEAFSKKFEIPFSLQVHLKKQIPTGAGLGGGSGNAAVVLKYLCEWASRRGHSSTKIKRALPKIAAKLGADIPFFLYDSPAWCTGFGEKCQPFKLRSYAVVVVMPKTKVPTPWAYRTLDSDRKNSATSIHLVGKPNWLESSQEIPELVNDFEATALRHKPNLKRALQLLSASGASVARMSGSGSAFFGIYKDYASAQKAARFIRARKMNAIACQTIQGFSA